MLISEKINVAINAQIGFELGNSNQYLSIASYFEGESLFGLAKLFFKQADEERDHALKLLKFVLDSGGKVNIPAVPAPRGEFSSAEDAAQFALDSEVRTTEQVYELVELATREKNYITVNFLQWFVSEQLEEVSSARRAWRSSSARGPMCSWWKRIWRIRELRANTVATESGSISLIVVFRNDLMGDNFAPRVQG